MSAWNKILVVFFLAGIVAVFWGKLAHAGEYPATIERFSPEDEARLTREAPAPHNCSLTSTARGSVWICYPEGRESVFDRVRDALPPEVIKAAMAEGCRATGGCDE